MLTQELTNTVNLSIFIISIFVYLYLFKRATFSRSHFSQTQIKTNYNYSNIYKLKGRYSFVSVFLYLQNILISILSCLAFDLSNVKLF